MSCTQRTEINSVPSPVGEGQVNTPINRLKQGEVVTTRIEKTVFISYRRTNLPWALAIYQDLTLHGYDVFFDYQNINSGDFEQIIIENIKARAHFIVILTPSALERCKEPGDWLRQEIETAIEEKRNIVPIMLESFDFGNSSVTEALTGKLSSLKYYNGLRVFSDYFNESMARLRERYLNIPLEAVLHPLPKSAQVTARKQQVTLDNRSQVSQDDLISQEIFEEGRKLQNAQEFQKAVSLYTEALKLKPDFYESYEARGLALASLGALEEAIQDFTKALQYKSKGKDINKIKERDAELARKLAEGAIALHNQYYKPTSARSLFEENNKLKKNTRKETKQKLRIFLSYTKKDKPLVKELYSRLLSEGYDVWLDEENLLPGQDWNLEIEKAIENTDAVIVIMSQNTITKDGYIQKELQTVLYAAQTKPEGTIFIIPIRLDNCEIPRRFRMWQYLDYFPQEKQEIAYKQLLKSLKVINIKHKDGE